MLSKSMLGLRRVAATKYVGLNVMRASFSTNAGEKFTEKMAKTGRPVAPHVMHYAWPVAAISSITNRITGGCLSVGMSGMGFLAIMGSDVGGILSSIGNSGVGPLAKFCVAFPLTYHYVGGVRHLVWDFYPETVTNEKCATSSYAVGGVAIVVSAGLAMTSF